jgi:hypothetical protein
VSAEGWYVDPFGVHEARWISEGTPTSLVRDGTLESKDLPPDATFKGPFEALAEPVAADGADLRRADDREAAPEDSVAGATVWDAFVETSGGD